MGSALPLIISLLLIFMLFTLLRRRGSRVRPEAVQSILYDVKINQALAETFHVRGKPRIFETGNWQMNKGRVGFLTEPVKKDLNDAFGLVDEYNKQIKTAKKARSDSYKTLDVTRLKELMDKCRQELEDWMVEVTGMKELPPKYPTLTGFLFGDRS